MRFFKVSGNLFSLLMSLKHCRKERRDILKAKDSEDPRSYRNTIAHCTYMWAKSLCDKYNITVRTHGREKVPEDVGCVFISNHQGYMDIIAMFMALKTKQVGFVAKDTLKQIPYLGRWIEDIGGVYIHRGDPRAALKTMKQGRKMVEQGFSLVIFPEGTRSQGPHIGDFKAGSFKLASGDAPIVPVTISGTYRLYEENGYVVGGDDRGVDVTFHDPIYPANLDRAEVKALPNRVRNVIEGGL